MITSDFKDADGFRLQFEESCPDEERKFYMKTFPRVDFVAKDRIHCTTCDMHVGTAPISEKIIRTHQILNVTQCNKCFAFYNSGEFGKGEDGSEYYCRWCGQGGEVFCCSTCPFVFCNKCIRDNLTQSYIKEIESNDDWSCFVCNKEILKRLRAQHWALRNFMNKQLEKIQNVNINSEEELNNMLNDDSSTCCPRKKRKQILKPAPAPIKRPSMNGGSIVGQPPTKRQQIFAPTKPLKVPVNANYHLTKPGPKPQQPGPRRNNDEIVCTPDIVGMLKDKNKSSTSNAPPPLIMRQNQARPVRPTGPSPANPIFHTVNGYQIDLNQASRQEIFRLPNGKLIQVRKQTNTQQGPPRPTPAGMPMAAPRTQFTIRPNQPMANQARMMRPSIIPTLRPVRAPQPAQQRPTPAASTSTSGANTSTIFTQQNGSISVARAPQPDTPFGKAKTAFEDKIINGLEICQHTINKMITLTNSTSFKTSRNFSDLKELYIHLQYLFTYTSGKIKTLQDNLVSGMEELTKHDVALKEKNEDDELEIVEQKQDVIEVLSDDEGDDSATAAAATKKALEQQPATSAAASSTLQENVDIQQELFANLMDTIENSITKFIPKPPVISLESCNYETNDKKLKVKSVVKVERLEDSKSSVVKQYMIAIQQRRDRSESRENTPDDFPLMPEIVMDESGDASAAENGDEKVDDDAKTCEDQNPEETNEAREKSSEDVVEIASDDETDNNKNETTEKRDAESKKPCEENGEEESVVAVDSVIDNDATVDETNEDIPDLPEKEASSQDTETLSKTESVVTISSTEMVENGVEMDEEDGKEANEADDDVSMLSVEEISKITENGIDEKELLDNLISSLDENEPLTPLELENFP